MACGHAFESSVIIEDHFGSSQGIPEQNLLTTSTPSKLSSLVKLDNELAWNGLLKSLKLFVQSGLSIEGQWSSPGGEVKQFTSKDYIIKWYGKKKQKISIIRDDKSQSLREKLVKFAALNEVNRHDGKQWGEARENSNMVEVAENSLSDDAKYDPGHTIIDQDDVDSSKIDIFAESGHKFINSQCHCRELALQLKHIKHDIHGLKSRAETCDANEILGYVK